MPHVLSAIWKLLTGRCGIRGVRPRDDHDARGCTVVLNDATSTVEQLLRSALAHHQAGRLPEAEGIYRQILAQQPDHPETLRLLGILASQVNRHEIAIELIRRALTVRPHFPEAYLDLGNAVQAMGQLDEAINCFRRAVALNPTFSGAYNNLGFALH